MDGEYKEAGLTLLNKALEFIETLYSNANEVHFGYIL